MPHWNQAAIPTAAPIEEAPQEHLEVLWWFDCNAINSGTAHVEIVFEHAFVYVGICIS